MSIVAIQGQLVASFVIIIITTDVFLEETIITPNSCSHNHFMLIQSYKLNHIVIDTEIAMLLIKKLHHPFLSYTVIKSVGVYTQSVLVSYALPGHQQWK